MPIFVKVLKAGHGDSILVSHRYENKIFNLLIDGGPASTFSVARRPGGNALKIVLDEVIKSGSVVDLAILTHVDGDHIEGLIGAFKVRDYLPALAKKVWFNTSKYITDYFDHPEIVENEIKGVFDSNPNTSIAQAKTLELLLRDLNVHHPSLIKAGDVYQEGPFKITILSPSIKNLEKLLCIWPREEYSPNTSRKETDHKFLFKDLLIDDVFVGDSSIANGSSIAFILEADNKKMLFFGDAYAEVLTDSLRGLGYTKENPIKAEFVKVSHHGSKHNTSPELLDLIDTRVFIVSTDGAHFNHPDKITLARILSHNPANIIYANYESVIKSVVLPVEADSYKARFFVNPTAIEL